LNIRSWLYTLGCAWLVWIAAPARSAQTAHWSLAQVLQQMDRQAQSFRTLTARVERTKVTVLVNDRSTEVGQMYLRRDNRLRIDLTAPDERTVLLTGDQLYLYTPRIRQVEQYSLARHRGLVEQFLLLGFGTRARQLERAYLITLLGEQPLDDHRTVVLDLVPRDNRVRQQVAHIQLWLDESSWLPLQQKIFEAGTQDYSVIRYSALVRNVPLSDSLFKPHWPRGTQRIKPQG
jgi:outer membrane lipoprotein-sorting protein